MGAEAGWKGELYSVATVELERLVRVVALVIEVYLEPDGSRSVGHQSQGFLIVSGHKIRIGWRLSRDETVLPRTADTDGFAEFP